MQRIWYATTTKRWVKTTDTEQYCLREDRGYVLIQRVCCWIMSKIGAFVERDEAVIDVNYVDVTDSDIKHIYNQSREMLVEYNHEPGEVLMGSSDFAQLVNKTDSRHYLSFNAESPNGSVAGLKITVIPWMKGMLVLPKE